ncbi:response regulator [Leucobacter denitrificans]|uniref:Response regulator transcription factor n=1 Tax=Leucobacter denitrificans TaxID=683042 RepID=A0A7G9S219_9MICO|nr:response regulator transcription factor [Leucobacter denitrificans]QNN61894.1 response regulator transcription factor [Leucobacter denitrificans]
MIRVLLVDDQSLVRSGFRVILDSEPDIEVVGEATNGSEAVALAAELSPDVICMDVEMPVMNGIEASRQILGAGGSGGPDGSKPAVLVLTTFGHEEYLFDALAAGVSGFLLKTSRAEQLIDGVRLLASGGSLLSPEVTGAVLSRVRGSGAPGGGSAAPTTYSAQNASGSAGSNAGGTVSNSALNVAVEAAGLTEREREVLGLLAHGHTNAEIAGSLFLGEATVKTHVSNLLQKLGVRDRLQAVVWAHTRS